MVYIIMAYIAMVVMAYMSSYGLHSRGLHSYGMCADVCEDVHVDMCVVIVASDLCYDNTIRQARHHHVSIEG